MTSRIGRREGDRPAEIEMGERPEIDAEPRQRRLVEAPALAQRLDQRRHRRRSRRYRRRPRRRGAASSRKKVPTMTISSTGMLPISRRRRRISARRMEVVTAPSSPTSQEMAFASPTCDRAHDLPVEMSAGQRRRPRHARSHIRPSRHPSIHVSAQFETAQRGLLATFFTAVARDRDEAPFGDVDQRQVVGDQLLELACRARCALAASSVSAALAISASSSALA